MLFSTLSVPRNVTPKLHIKTRSAARLSSLPAPGLSRAGYSSAGADRDERAMNFGGFLLLAIPLLVGCSSAPPGRYRLDLANADPATAIPALADAHFARLLNERSGGRIRIATHFGGALGYESRDHFEAVETGALDLASSPLDKLVGLAPIFQLQSLPFLTPGHREARALYEVARPHYEAAFREVGQTLLYAGPWTPIGIWAKRRLEHPAQLAGLKIRTFDRNGAATLKTAGAAPVQLAWSDVVPALSTNLIEAVLTSDESGVAGKFWEHMEYFHDLGYGVGVSVVHINSRVLDGLPADLQAIVRETAAEVETAAWERARVRVAHNRSVLEKHGISVISDVPQLADRLMRAGSPLLDEWRAAMGEEPAAAILAAYHARLAGSPPATRPVGLPSEAAR